ncbi:uncharacterized protein CCOS01_09956 [Colletotrichum costaricense]|uniref:Uncharacterized protein n=1 Tax=Colletotrichum costaricense TaxID=1209916 RepID=A0AAI9YSG1_9PEZI|nr:uncharacterized protein CCOS01_09956 [Colletotrichum costaricense]KAK1522244.1 hypothetical protein CCOS01_09956 [Colletotrichum costaricense]
MFFEFTNRASFQTLKITEQLVKVPTALNSFQVISRIRWKLRLLIIDLANMSVWQIIIMVKSSSSERFLKSMEPAHAIRCVVVDLIVAWKMITPACYSQPMRSPPFSQ